MSSNIICKFGLSDVSDPEPILYPQFILFGDSITQGSALSLQAYLATQYIRRMDIVNRGFSGYTAPLGLRAIRKFLPKALLGSGVVVPQVKILTLWFGANDACAATGLPGDQHVPLDEYVATLEQIVRHAVLEAHQTKVIILTPPPVDEHQFDASNPRTSALTAQYAAAAKNLAQRMNLPLVDVWTLFMLEAGHAKSFSGDVTMLPGSKSAPSNQRLKDLLWDGLHLSTQAYQLVFMELMSVILREMPELAPENLPLEICECDDSVPSTLPRSLTKIVNRTPGFGYERWVADLQMTQEGYPTQQHDRDRVERSCNKFLQNSM